MAEPHAMKKARAAYAANGELYREELTQVDAWLVKQH